MGFHHEMVFVFYKEGYKKWLRKCPTNTMTGSKSLPSHELAKIIYIISLACQYNKILLLKK